MPERKYPLITDEGTVVQAICPVIISASRSTDIPAYYTDWFMKRLKTGYIRWINSFNPNLPYYVSLQNTRAIVFWSKNPAPIFSSLDYLDELGLSYYFQYTLNDYEKEGFEPGVPSLEDRITSFKNLSDRIGKERVIWRFDPVLVTPNLAIPELLSRIEYIGSRISPYTEKMVFSFVEMRYAKVKKAASVFHFRALSPEEKEEFISGIIRLNREWHLTLASCADETDYSPLIIHNKCIDDELLFRIGKDDSELMKYLRETKKDHGQRPACHCIRSKDVGQYDTCLHGCVYCYATDHEKAVLNFSKHKQMPESDTITGEKPVCMRPVNNDITKYIDS